MTSQDEIKIRSLQDYLFRIACKMANRYHYSDPEDLLGAMNLALVERADQDPTFLDQSDSYITSFAAWEGRDYVRKEMWYSRAAEVDEELQAAPTIFDSLSETVQDLVSGVDGTTRRIVEMLAQGYRSNEIAAELGISSSCVCRRLQKLAAERQADAAQLPLWQGA